MAKNEQAQRFHAGTLTDGWRWFGAHPAEKKGEKGWSFRVWAPHAKSVSVVGDFNNWEAKANRLIRKGEVWEGFIPGLPQYSAYKYAVTGPDGTTHLKADPYGFHAETRPATASKLYDISGFKWTDKSFREKKLKHQVYDSPLNIYEVHLGSWKKRDNGDYIDYRDLARDLAAYVKEMGYTAIELLPVTEHPLDDSWGYQCTGYFAPTSRFGQPKDFMWFVNHMHKNGISVLLDWVPAHFCKDEQGLYQFDGTCCYEYSDHNKWEHASWGTRVFDYGKGEVRSFLLSSAIWWLREYHMDGLRVDAVASMLYLDYGRTQWRPNARGGRENLEAVSFLRLLNRTVHAQKPGALMIAEESTAWPHVTGEDGLGFDLKWNMGWMNDLCHYLKMDPFFRRDHHRDITFSMMYAFSERFVLPISHDEVVHMKGSLRGKMPGDKAMQLAAVKGFIAYMLAHPGCKLLFMGGEIPQWKEWDFAGELDWGVLSDPAVAAAHGCIRALNRFYRDHPPLWEHDAGWDGFSWLVADDNRNNIIVFLRRDLQGEELICAVNFSPVAREEYRFGVPEKAAYREVFNTDSVQWGGSGFINEEPIAVEAVPSHGRQTSISVRIPPLGAVYLQGEGRFKQQEKGADHP